MITRDRLPYFVVFVKDHSTAADFFTQNLHLQTGRFPASVPAGKLAGIATALALHGTTLLLVNDSAKDVVAGVESGRGYPSFEVADLATFHAAAKKNGTEVVQEPTVGDFGTFAAYRGPDGLIVMAVQVNKLPESHGIVLSGGGAYGAFELGVLRKLAASVHGSDTGLNSLRPSVLTGTSVGAFNAAWLACAISDSYRTLPEIAEGLVNVWRKKIAGGIHNNGVFRVRGDVLSLASLRAAPRDSAFLAADLLKRLAYVSKSVPPELSRLLESVDISSLISAEPLRELLQETLSWQALQKSPCRLQIAATDWEAGTVRLFGHGSSVLPHEELMRESNFRDCVMASTAIPGFFAPVEVEADKPDGGREKRLYVDGGLVMNSPLNPAIDAGATVVHLICLNPDVNTLTLSPVNSTLDTLERSLATAVASGVCSELARVKLGNRLAGIVRRQHSDDFYREVTVHRYHPDKQVLGGVPGILDFSLKHIDELIANGEKVAGQHDCKQAGCILPQNQFEPTVLRK